MNDRERENEKAIGQLLNKLNDDFYIRKEQFLSLLPSTCSFEKFTRIALTAATKTPDLLKADKRSFFLACLQCAQDGLVPDGKEGCLIFSKKTNKVQYQPMIGGILKKIRNSGELLSITSQIVYENDFFDYVLGDKEEIIHRPLIDRNRGKPRFLYAIAITKDAGIYREIMSYEEVEHTRRTSSKSPDSGPWVNQWGEMARKTVLKRLAKRLPLSTDVEEMFRREDEREEYESSNEIIKNKNSVIDQINAQLENKSAVEELQENGCVVIDDPRAESPKVFEAPPLKQEDFNSWSEEIIPNEAEITKIEMPTIDDPKNELPFISRGELNRYIAGAKAGKCTWKELASKYQMTKEDRLYALGQGAAILIEPGSM